MSLFEISRVCRDRFNTVITTGQADSSDPLRPIGEADPVITQFPNMPFHRPEDQPWVSMHVLFGDKGQRSFGRPGNNRYRQVGNLVAMVMVPIARGETLPEQIANRIIQCFQTRQATGSEGTRVKFLVPKPSTPGQSGGWWQINVTCPFYADTFE